MPSNLSLFEDAVGSARSSAVDPEWDLFFWKCQDAVYTQDRIAHRDSYRGIASSQEGHRKMRLDYHKSELQEADASQLLAELAGTFGLSWIDLAQLIGVTIPAIRKWRQGGSVSAENTERLRGLVAFLRTLKDLQISDPVNWMHSRLVPEEATVTPLHLYSEENTVKLLEFASQGGDSTYLLNDLVPDWRARFRSEFRVSEIGPGERAVVRK